MSGDFEENISQRMDGFRLTPGPQVWERVAAALPEKRRRRKAIWWWLPLAACLGGGAWLMVDKQPGNDKKIITGTAGKPSAEYTGTSEKLLKQAPVDTAKKDAATHQQTATIIEKKNNNQPLDNINKKEIIISKKESKSNSYSGNSTVALQAFTVKAKRNVAIAETDWPVAKKQSSVDKESLENNTLTLNAAGRNMRLKMPVNSDSFLNRISVPLLVDSFVNHLAKTNIVKDTAAIKMADTISKTSVATGPAQLKKKVNKPKWSLTVAAGRASLDNNNSNKLERTSATDYNIGGPSLNGGSPGAVRTTSIFSNPQTGFGFNAGITRSQTISKHFSWQATISYQLLTSTQRIGRRNDSLLRVARQNDSLTKSNTGTSAAFFTGNAANYTNKVHRIYLVSDVGYIVNPAAHSPIRFSAGVSVAYNVSNNLLLHDYRSASYIRSAESSNKLMWGGEVGVDVFINHKIKAGLFYQHDFTNVGKPKVRSVFRWNQVQVRVGIPLSKH